MSVKIFFGIVGTSDGELVSNLIERVSAEGVQIGGIYRPSGDGRASYVCDCLYREMDLLGATNEIAGSRLREREGLSGFVGKTPEEEKSIWTLNVNQLFQHGVCEIEPTCEFRKRIRDVLEHIGDRHDNEAIIILTYPGVYRMMKHICGGRGKEIHKIPYLKPGGVATLTLEKT